MSIHFVPLVKVNINNKMQEFETQGEMAAMQKLSFIID